MKKKQNIRLTEKKQKQQLEIPLTEQIRIGVEKSRAQLQNMKKKYNLAN